jgi:putative Holliday junction resolvase
MSKAIGIDFGLKRTGIAITDDLCIIASPLTVVESSNLMQFLSEIIIKENVSTLVLGYPTRLDGSDSHITENVRILKSELEKNFVNVKVVFQDERYSSEESMRVVHKAGKKKQLKDKGLIDKISAAIILQDYLETLSNLQVN